MREKYGKFQMDSAFCGLDGSAFSSDRSSGSDF
jgi:hypothetical protein